MKHLLFFVFSFLLSASVFSQRVDTITNDTWQNNAWQPSSREIFSYNSSCLATTVLFQNFQQGTSTWADTLLVTYTYNANNQVSQTIFLIWNSTTNTWDSSLRQTQAYNSNNLLDSSLSEAWFGNTWQNVSLLTYSYNPDNLVDTVLSQIWITSWTNSSRTTYTYNADKTVSTTVTETAGLFGGSFSKQSRDTFSYSASKKVLTDLNQLWKNNQWKNNQLLTYTYDANDYLTNLLAQTWVNSSSTWENDYQTNYTNNSDGTIAQTISQNWDRDSSIWVNTDRMTYSYNSCALPLTLASFTATLKDKIVVLNWATLTESNTKNFVVQRSGDGVNFQTIGTVNAAGNSTQRINYQYSDASAYNAGIPKFYYRLQMVDKDGSFTLSKVADVQFIITSLIKIAPNPVTNVLNIQGLSAERNSKLTIFDQTGKVQKTVSVLGDTYNWSLENLSAGMYYIMVEQDGKKVANISFIKVQ